MDDQQLHMDAVSALTSLQASVSGSSGGGGGVPPRTSASHGGTTAATNTTSGINMPPYVSCATTVAATGLPSVMGHSMVQRHYSEDYTVPPQSSSSSSYFGVGGKPEDHAVGNGAFHHSFPTTASMYGTTSSSSLNGSTAALLQGVLPPFAQQLPGVSVVQLPNLHLPIVPTSMPLSRQGSSSSSMVSSQERAHYASLGQEVPSSSVTTMYHPLHPNDRPKVAARTHQPILVPPPPITTPPGETAVSHRVAHPVPERNPTTLHRLTSVVPVTEQYVGQIYHPPHPSERNPKSMHDHNDDDDDEGEEDEGENDRALNYLTPVTAAGAQGDNDDDEMEGTAPIIETIVPKPRGKPEAAARALAAAKLEEHRQQDTCLDDDDEDDDDDHDHVVQAVAMGVPKKATARSNAKKSSPKKAAPSRKKHPASTTATVLSSSVLEEANAITVVGSNHSHDNNHGMEYPTTKREFLLGEVAPDMTDAEYHSLQEMMIQFCRVPLLSEFSRPVAMLHPEVTTTILFRIIYMSVHVVSLTHLFWFG